MSSFFWPEKNMAGVKAGVDTVATVYRAGRAISGAMNTASALGTIANLLGIGAEEEVKHFDPRDNDPYADNDIQDGGVVASDLDRANPQVPKPG